MNNISKGVTLHQCLEVLGANLCPKSPLLNTTNAGQTREEILLKLLSAICPHYFKSAKSLDYDGLLKILETYYNDHMKERLSRIYVALFAYTNKFEHLMRLVFDLAMNNPVEKERYVEEIINMGEHEKELLMPFMGVVMGRKFVCPLLEYDDNNEISVLDIKDEEYQELRECYEEKDGLYKELFDNYNNIKKNYEVLMADHRLLIEEKNEMMCEFDMHESSTFGDVLNKYKMDIKSYEIFIDRINKEIEDKTAKLETKEKELKEISLANNNEGIWEKEKAELIQKYGGLEKEVVRLGELENKLRGELEVVKEENMRLREEVKGKDEEIDKLLKIKIRYKSIKDAHQDFKKNFVQRMADN